MSLIAGAIRTCVVLALWRATLAEDRIYDSVLSPVDELVADVPKPFITVSIDEAVTENHPGDTTTPALLDISALTLVIDICIGAKMQVEGANGDTETSVVIPFTDAGLEWSLNLISRQVEMILTANGGWADLFRRFMGDAPHRVFRIRGGGGKGSKFAAHQLAIVFTPLSDPTPGATLDEYPVVRDFIAALRGIASDPVLGREPELEIYPALADAIEASVIAPVTLTNWDEVAASMGLPIEVTDAIGLADIGTATEFDVVPADTDPTFVINGDTP